MNQGRLKSAILTTWELTFFRGLLPGMKAPSWWNLYLYHRGILQRRVQGFATEGSVKP